MTMDRDTVRRCVEAVVDGRHSTRVLRHDVLDEQSRKPFIDQLTDLVLEVDAERSKEAWAAEA